MVSKTSGLGEMSVADIAQEVAKLIGAQPAPAATVTGPQEGERAVLVTTEYRGVFFGYAKDTSGETIQLRASRNCLYWPPENKGFLGLASMGPQKGSKVGPAADIELRKITCVAEVDAAAVAAWESAPWGK
jgi:hypothetical protein